MNGNPWKGFTWSQDQFFCWTLFESSVPWNTLRKYIIIYSINHSENRWDKIYSRSSHLLSFGIIRFCAKVSLLRNPHRRHYWTLIAFIECLLCARHYDLCWEHWQVKTDTDPHLTELMSFHRYVTQEEVTTWSLFCFWSTTRHIINHGAHVYNRLEDNTD